MGLYRLDSIASLARQLEFAPREVRAGQLGNAETFLHALQLDQAYPADLVIHRITGYRPREVPDALLTGLALRHDLSVLIERVSQTLDLHTRDIAEPVLAIEDVTQRFNVTSKTIQRWRRKGLVSRRFTFPDGKRRVGFLLSSIERFVAANTEAVERGTNFSQVDEQERALMVRHARRLAEKCRCCVREITRRIARRFDRSPLTVLHTIRKHDQESPQSAVFPGAASEVKETTRARIVRASGRRLPLGLIVSKVRRTRAAVYRVLLDDRIEKLTRRKVRFHDDPLYHLPNAEQLLADLVSGGALSRPAETVRPPRGLPPYLETLYRTPLLTPQQERALFLQFNFYKYLFVRARRRLEPEVARKREIDELDRHAAHAGAVKNRIITANLRLVVSIARSHVRPTIGLMELVSEGNIILMRAAESFDVHRGVRFGTYATLALMKGFARIVPQYLKDARGTGLDSAVDIADVRADRDSATLLEREQVGRLLSRLSDAERRVIELRYGISGGVSGGVSGGEEPLDGRTAGTCNRLDVGVELGVSRHRVRQLEEAALSKLRSAFASGRV